MMSIMLISTKQVSAQWALGGNVFTAPGGCVKAKFGTLNDGCDILFINSAIERMRLTSDGYFGIGTTTPMRVFHVNGDIRFENLPAESQTTALMIDANGDLSTRVLQISNWNTAYGWGNHAGLYRPASWVPTWNNVTNKPNFANVATSGSYNDLSNKPNLSIADWNNAYTWGNHATAGYLKSFTETDPLWTASPSYEITGTNITNWNTAYTWGNHDTVGYLMEETDPQWIADSVNYYTKSNLQVDGQSQVHYGNLTNVPTDLSDFSDSTNLLFDGDWSSLSGDAPNISFFNNDTGYITSPIDDDADPVNELQQLALSETALMLTQGNSVELKDLNYWSLNQTRDVYYRNGKVGVGLMNPKHSLHVHGNERNMGDETGDLNFERTEFNGTDKGHILLPHPLRTRSVIQITNMETGTDENDGLQLMAIGKNAIIKNKEQGKLTLQSTGLRQEFTANGDVLIGGTGQTHFFVSQSGNVGVGTSNPGAKLDVNGNMHIKGNSALVQFENSNTGHKWEIYSGGSIGNNGLGIFDRTTSQYLIAFAANGNVGIGTENPSLEYKLDVKGEMRACKLHANNLSNWCDYVFEDDYELMPLDSLDAFVKKNKHLPGMPTETEVMENGIDLGEMNAKLLEKVEELSLYVIAQEKRIKELEKNLAQ
jgi:hypothetical protein